VWWSWSSRKYVVDLDEQQVCRWEEEEQESVGWRGEIEMGADESFEGAEQPVENARLQKTHVLLLYYCLEWWEW
jgi:hypothetical protein